MIPCIPSQSTSRSTQAEELNHDAENDDLEPTDGLRAGAGGLDGQDDDMEGFVESGVNGVSCAVIQLSLLKKCD